MFADLPPDPPAIVRLIPSRKIMIWGDPAAMERLRARMEKSGWDWVTGVLGEETPMLILQPPPAVADATLTAFLNEINKGTFGRLSAGYAMLGSPHDG